MCTLWHYFTREFVIIDSISVPLAFYKRDTSKQSMPSLAFMDFQNYNSFSRFKSVTKCDIWHVWSEIPMCSPDTVKDDVSIKEIGSSLDK